MMPNLCQLTQMHIYQELTFVLEHPLTGLNSSGMTMESQEAQGSMEDQVVVALLLLCKRLIVLSKWKLDIAMMSTSRA